MKVARNLIRNDRFRAERARPNLFRQISALSATRMADFCRLTVDFWGVSSRSPCNRDRTAGEECDVTLQENTRYWSAVNMLRLADKNLADFVVSASNRGDLEPAFR